MTLPTIKPLVAIGVIAISAAIGVGGTFALSAYGQTTLYPAGTLYQGGGWTANQFGCAPGYNLANYHWDEGSSNNATWYACLPNGSTVGGTPPAPANTCDATCVDNDIKKEKKGYCSRYGGMINCNVEAQ